MLVSSFVAAMFAWLACGMVGSSLFDRYLFVPGGLILAASLVVRDRTHANPEELSGSASHTGDLETGATEPRASAVQNT
jgi:hypothetical protein